jgi:hypothetical protein
MLNLPKLQFPLYEFRFKNSENKTYIFDPIRKKFILITPEEWVRQHVIQYLIHDLKYPKSHIAVEKQLILNQTIKRSDVLVQNAKGEIIILVECKAPQITINQDTFDQTARYNMIYDAKYLYVCNGFMHIYCQLDKVNQQYKFLESLPTYTIK